jgi:hypothetical protein
VKTRNGVPGADKAPRAMAVISQRGTVPFAIIWAASGIAIAPAIMSPHPAEVENGAARRPSACRIRKKTPATRTPWMPCGEADSDQEIREQISQPDSAQRRSE